MPTDNQVYLSYTTMRDDLFNKVSRRHKVLSKLTKPELIKRLKSRKILYDRSESKKQMVLRILYADRGQSLVDAYFKILAQRKSKNFLEKLFI